MSRLAAVPAAFLLLAPAVGGAALAAQSARPAAAQVAAAVAPLPDSLRAGARVLGYGADGRLVTLRRGTNEQVCLADDPARDGFHVACYHRDLEPFMARGRELRAAGVTDRTAIDSVRGAEIRARTLAMPPQPTTLYELFGKDDGWDPASGAVRAADAMWSVYIPYATTASTGLQLRPVPGGGPWLMAPGTPWAHIMVVPERTRH
ncbi:MAG: hypothetical protein NW201_00495 [Gemmatimonadales bacterium]|nr:hypothetical protein [Gemmatimonadales bacterium]